MSAQDGGALPGRELFEAVQQLQGFAFISDAHDDKPLAKVLAIAECSLANTEATANILRRFIAKYKDAARHPSAAKKE